MNLETYLEQLKTRDEQFLLEACGVSDNFTLFLKAEFFSTMTGIVQDPGYRHCEVLGSCHRFIEPASYVYVDFFDKVAKGMIFPPCAIEDQEVTCGLEGLAEPEVGRKHILRQKNEYSLTIILHPTATQTSSAKYKFTMAQVITQIGSYCVKHKIPLCMPSPAGAKNNLHLKDQKMQIDYESIVYYDPV